MGASVAANLALVRGRIADACAAAGRDPDSVELLAVSKTRDADLVLEAYAEGQRSFGENRVQELEAKAQTLRERTDLRWHLIGSLQTNKVNHALAVPGLELVHSLDRVKLANALHRAADGLDGEVDVLLQVDATGEASKHGVTPEAAADLLAHVLEHCDRLRVRGVMAMGPREGSPRPTFERVAALRSELATQFGLELPILSLGMTGDLEEAIAAGSTLVRIGTAIFGPRVSQRP